MSDVACGLWHAPDVSPSSESGSKRVRFRGETVTGNCGFVHFFLSCTCGRDENALVLGLLA